jgi:hypothetical protein
MPMRTASSTLNFALDEIVHHGRVRDVDPASGRSRDGLRQRAAGEEEGARNRERGEK